MIHHGDCLEVLPTLPENSVDACVTDPPYGLGFMGKNWDHGIPGVAFWTAILRVLKPGAHLVAFGGTRTSHRLVCAIEDAGFEIRDSLCWLFGQGFPKSLNLGDGWGTALKPAHEPICLARKPLDGTVAANVQRWGTGAINVGGCRIPIEDGNSDVGRAINRSIDPTYYGWGSNDREAQRVESVVRAEGRWPANVVLDEEAARLLDSEVGRLQSGLMHAGTQRSQGGGYHGNFPGEATAHDMPGDSGGPSRFFYTSKASRAEREEGLSILPTVRRSDGREKDIENPRLRTTSRKNHHPTVKPLDLMRWLCRLVTPKGGVILDPFGGSGTTACAAILEGFDFIIIEKEAEYIPIIEGRIANARAIGYQQELL